MRKEENMGWEKRGNEREEKGYRTIARIKITIVSDFYFVQIQVVWTSVPC